MIYDLVYEPSYLISLLSSSGSNDVDSLKGFFLLINFLCPNVNVNENQLEVDIIFSVN